MKKHIIYILLIAVMGVSLTSCSLWEDDWAKCKPLPEVDGGIDTDPWEPGDEDEHPIGN